MAKKSLLVATSLLALAVLGWLLAGTRQPDRQAARLSPAPGGTRQAAASGRLPDNHELRTVAEVFPGSEASAGNWRDHHPATLQVAPYPDLPMTFQQVAVKVDGPHLTWIGRNPAMPGASFVGIATPGGYDAVLLVPGSSQFNFHVRGGMVRVDEVVSSGKDCEGDPAAGVVAGAPDSSGVPTSPSPAGAGAAERALAAGAPLNVDVLFLYNTRALEVAAERSSDPVGYIDGYSRATLETANQVLQNSQVDTFAWRYVGLEPVPEYPQKQTVGEDLREISPDGQFAAQVRAARAQYGADQVLMWTGTGPRQGAAWGGQERNLPVERGGTIAALRLTAGTLILAHELAHNFGCHHDRGHAGSGDGFTAQPEGDGFWCYGLLWTPPGGTATQGTVMSYADSLVPYFSNPGITLGNQPLGYVETDPRAAYNARILNDHSAYIASESEETEAPPVILQQPQDAVTVSGQAVTLSVSAVGGGLSYQWARGGASLTGATSASYTLVITQTEVGGYSVMVSNSRGSATSRVAAVSLFVATPAPAPALPPMAAPSTGTGGGGGGGGAPSIWFHASLLVWYCLKRRRA